MATASPSMSIIQLKEIGESIGLKGTELAKFISEQQAVERDERDKQRAEKEAERVEAERQRQFQIERAADKEKERQAVAAEKEKERQHEAAEEEKRRRFEKEKAEALAVEEEKRRQYEREKAAEQERREQEKREQAVEQGRLKQEQERLKKEQAEEQERLRQAQAAEQAQEKAREREMQAAEKAKERQFEREKLERMAEIEQEKARSEVKRLEKQLQLNEQAPSALQSTGVHESTLSDGRTAAKIPKMPYFDETQDYMDSYLGRFERFAKAQGWKHGDWAMFLSALLKGRALDVYTRLPTESINDYDTLKDSLLKRYQMTADGFKQRFRSSKPEMGETPNQFLSRLDNYLLRWIELAKAEKTFEGLKTLIVQEQYLSTCSKEMAMRLKEGKPTTLKELGDLAETYVEAHSSDIVFGIDPKSRRIIRQPPDARRCHLCGSKDHLQRQCPIGNTGPTPAPPDRTNSQWRAPAPQPPQRSRQGPPKCFLCGKLGHIARNCLTKRAGAAELRESDSEEFQEGYESLQETAAFQSVRPKTWTKPSVKEKTCKKHHKSDCSECFDLPECTHQCQALVAVCKDCGSEHPVIADACQSKDKTHCMPVTEGFVEDKPVSVLRDTGCSTVVVRRSLVPDVKLTGKEECCVLIDGTIRRTPVAELKIDSPYFSGTVTAVCMKNPLYDLIIGNIPGAADPSTTPQPIQAVQTRSQSRTSKGLPPLVTPVIDFGSEDVATLQRQDDTLQKALLAAQDKTNTEFQITQGFLYRVKTNRRNEVIKQLALPRKLRNQVLTLAHAGVMSGHQGIHRTQERVLSSFWWPGLTNDVAMFCQSCDICQRTISKGRVPRVPLGKMPLIDIPFKRIAVDLIGELSPSSRGHQYILTVVDYATRYPEAIPLKNITTTTVAEALVKIFSRVGIPEEVLSDQGTQFISNLMKEVGRLLSIKQIRTTPYHPQCNGLVERFNGTLKIMLRRMCAEKPKDWDRYIDPLLFAYREVPQESLGFAPFELLYGRSVNGPLQILRQLWTREQQDPDTRTTYQYVVDLRNRLQETWDLAHDELRRNQTRYKKHFDRRSRERIFKAGDQVLILLPTSENKLLMQWKGPFQVVQRVEGNDYLLQLASKQKIFHANLLKRYFPPIPEGPEEPASEDYTGLQVASAAILESVEEQIDQGPELITYNDLQKESVQDVKINPDLDASQQAEVKTLLNEYKDIFTDVPGITNLQEHSIRLTSDEPIKGKAYPLPFAMQGTLDKEINSMLEMGIIEKSSAAYASPVVMVKKPDGSTRVCIDYRKLNSITIFDPEPMPTADQIFARLSGNRYFSKFDLSKGYWQVPVKDEDRDLTTFICHRGLYRFKVMPFGLVNAPATFSRLMRKVLNDSDNLDNYLDDVLAHTSDWKRHLAALRNFFSRIRKARLTLRPSKCEIGETTVSFLGHCLSEGKVIPRAETVQKILDVPPPRTLKQLRSFLGLASFYRKYVPNFAVVAAPLSDATRKGSSNNISWDESRERAFLELKQRISQPPILKLPDLDQPFILQTDASHIGIGAVLLQEDTAYEKRPVAFASRKLQPRESRYATIERECLAIVWGVTKFQEYLYGKEFILETDHQPLQYLRQAKFQNGRLMRWSLTLQPYRFLLRAIRGTDNVAADCLSRNPLDEDLPADSSESV